MWCPLQFDTPTAAESYARQRFAVEPAALETLGTIDHAFTHFDLSITPLLLQAVAAAEARDVVRDVAMEPSGVLWYNPRDGAIRVGLPAPGLERPVYPGELGVRIWRQVSKEGWQRWVAHQTMLINEYRLVPIEPKARKFLEGEMEKFIFGAGATKPEGFVAPPGG